MPVMAVPDYQTLMRPVLAQYEDGDSKAVADARKAVASLFQLTQEDLDERLPSGQARTFSNRVGWAVTYLYRAGLLERPKRSVYRITERGRSVLRDHPQRVDNDVLDQFAEFRVFRDRDTGEADRPQAFVVPPQSEAGTPQERMDAAHRQLESALAAELLDRIMDQPPSFFEQLVIDVLTAMGYGGSREDAGERLGGTGDEGFDGVIREDRLGLDVIYVQAKRWANPVGRPAIQGFVGALAGRGVAKGVFITTSTFTEEARRYAAAVQARVILVDGGELAGLMIEHGVGVTPAHRYVVSRVDLDYFTEDGASPGSADSPASGAWSAPLDPPPESVRPAASH
jgi:restriction system protein